ncbi:MAG TPA: 2-amino-4-hydroxy-6-hydroxymethyldihydropteridine diphosphokinase [Pirellulales bacterium]|nr:2-amino-4-hydroxy-6-hydroxymethyldihydropteridine diphosphokinase [Pirellulales bacterium]
MACCLIGLGANLGDRQATLSRAVAELASTPATVLLRQSRWHETAPVGGPLGQTAYLNGALTLETSLDPLDVLERLRQIERHLGRQRKVRWDARSVDLDLLLYGQLELDTPALTVPHPRMAFRRFVLQPAAEVAAEMVHPTTGWSVGRLLAHLDESAPYVAITGFPGTGKTRLAEEAVRETGARFLSDPEADLAPWAADDAQAEIERLSRRAQLLARDAWPADAAWTVSDFWFDQSLIWAATWLDAPGRAAVAGAWQALRGEITAPRLLVVLDARADLGSPDTSSLARAGGVPQELDAVRFRLWGAALVEQTRRPDRGPVLHLAADDGPAALAEVLAAITAML